MFGWIYNRDGDDRYSLMWDGNLDFSNVEDVAIHEVSGILGCGKFDLKRNLWYARRTLLTHKDYVLFNNELIEDYISCCKDSFLNKKMTKGAAPFSSFIRYDVSVVNKKDNLLIYSLTAENPVYSDEPCEVAILQPTRQGFNRGLLEFMIKTHNDSDVVNGIDLDVGAAVIGDFLKSR